jgi:hypothetical protein
VTCSAPCLAIRWRQRRDTAQAAKLAEVRELLEAALRRLEDSAR